MDNAYGQTHSEKLANDSKIAREIVKEIGTFGINDRQRWLILYHLAMELENVEEMRSMVDYIKEVKGDSIFISRIYAGDEVQS